MLYFASNRDAIVDQQVYTARLDGRDAQAPHRVSQVDGWHDAQFAKDASRVALYVDTYSDATTPPQVSVHAPDGRRLAWIEANQLQPGHPYWPYQEGQSTPEFGQLKAEDGQDLQYSLLKPADFDAKRRYPVYVDVYGGPTAQNVQRRWSTDFFDQYMARHGYVVFRLDNRGSTRRSRAFTDALYGRLGDIEVRDQLSGVRWLRRAAMGGSKTHRRVWLELRRLHDPDAAGQRLRSDRGGSGRGTRDRLAPVRHLLYRALPQAPAGQSTGLRSTRPSFHRSTDCAHHSFWPMAWPMTTYCSRIPRA